MKNNKINIYTLLLFLVQNATAQEVFTSDVKFSLDSSQCITHQIFSYDSTRKLIGYSFTKCINQDSVISEEYSSVLSPYICPNMINGFLMNGIHKKYYKNGLLKEITNYIYGRPTGLYLLFYENGNLKTKGNYENIVNICDFKINIDTIVEYGFMIEYTSYGLRFVNKKVGEWTYYYPTGEIEKAENW